ncbi:DUF4251 domain-containing protein [Poritiphilus flavus]|uniref:DUF4251 domain-containing protein n=1 Tax=Poritiphilus flavus TaxID=2697053 RepID=A0A6L9EES7_9FLAO|nr:DUF4251 domain-containing protein [Poritiphilus flavus]NAS13245.1 DUF4251 domain-containing protein [Poritiphilus flavus]
MKKFLLIAFTMVFLTSMSYAQDNSVKKELRKEKADAAYNYTKDLIISGDYVFEANRAYPLGTQSVTLTTRPNQIRINGKEADISLPYFGAVRSGGGFNHTNGIQFKGEVRNYEVEYRDDKRKAIIRFDVANDTETHRFFITAGKAGDTRVIVSSSARNSISYYGILGAPDKASR